jgi:hypothetical protein
VNKKETFKKGLSPSGFRIELAASVILSGKLTVTVSCLTSQGPYYCLACLQGHDPSLKLVLERTVISDSFADRAGGS